MKGIILAGGSGTRLYPITIPTIKQLLPIYDKPMIYYPLSVLLQAGVTEILIISTPRDTNRIEELFGDGSKLGLKIEYKVQNKPGGLAEALILGEDFLNGDAGWLVLGDNLLYGANLTALLREVPKSNKGATIFGYHVSNPKRFGVIEFDDYGKVISLEEKPEKPKSNYVAIGIYYFDKRASQIAKTIKPSKRGELEITDLNNVYLNEGTLDVRVMNRGFTWFDAGTHNSIVDATNFVKVIEEAQGLKIGCIEELSYRRGLISKDQLLNIAKELKKTNYGKYLSEIAKEDAIILPDHAKYNLSN